MASQVWQGTVEGRVHRVETSGDISRTVTWSVDGETVAEKKTMDDKAVLEADTAVYDGSLVVRFSTLGAPRRATLLATDDVAELGVGGTDLTPEPGSPAALHHDKLLANPTRYTALATLGGVVKVVVPLLIAALVARLAVAIPWPDVDLPDIPLPDLPSIPWPDIDLPSVPLPDVTLPGWLAWILDNIHFVWPVILAFYLARREINRRRKQAAALEAEEAEEAKQRDERP